jgi:hypothetical protein
MTTEERIAALEKRVEEMERGRTFIVNVSVGSDDDRIRELAQQGAQKVLSDFNETQQRGGFGATQRRHQSHIA